MADLEPTAAHREILRAAAAGRLRLKGIKIYAGTRSVTPAAYEMLNAGWLEWDPEYGCYKPTPAGLALLPSTRGS